MIKYFQKVIADLKKEERYREFVDISRICGEFPYAIRNENGKKITVWCSNDYLALGQNNVAIEAAVDCIRSCGLGAGGTRNISGNHRNIVELEKTLADLHQQEAALTFTSGYVANDTTIQTLGKIIPNLVIFSDEKNHASIIAGIRNSRLEKNVFKHNDEEDLEKALKKYPKETPKIIIFESVYSMSGGFGKVKEFISLAKKYNCLTFIDEVHGVGLYGENGVGRCEELGLLNEVDIIQGTLAKAYGVFGGYIVAKKDIIDAIRSAASGFIFTTTIPPIVAVSALKNIETSRDNSDLRNKMHANVAKVKAKILEKGFDIEENNSHIISLKIGDAKRAKEISGRLLEEFNIYVQHINYPTVEKGDERLRITANPMHSDKMIDELIDALEKTMNVI